MRLVMTDDEVESAARLDKFAKARACGLAQAFAKLPASIVDIVRVWVCELALRSYTPFASKFRAGNSQALRELLDAWWAAIDTNTSFPAPLWVQARLNSADFDADDWDHRTASDAVAALCIIDACFGSTDSAQDRVEALRCGLEHIFSWETKKIIDHCAETDGVLSDLAVSVESGAVLIPVEQAIVAGFHIAERVGNYPEKFADWVRESLSNSALG